MNIFIGSLPFRVKEEELKGFFEEYGEVASCRIITDKFSGRSKGYGFIEMPNDDQALKAIEELNGSEVDGRTIVVNKAEERKEGERRTGGGGNENRLPSRWRGRDGPGGIRTARPVRGCGTRPERKI